MSILDIAIVVLVGICFAAAFYVRRKKGGCGGDCACCPIGNKCKTNSKIGHEGQ